MTFVDLHILMSAVVTGVSDMCCVCGVAPCIPDTCAPDM